MGKFQNIKPHPQPRPKSGGEKRKLGLVGAARADQTQFCVKITLPLKGDLMHRFSQQGMVVEDAVLVHALVHLVAGCFQRCQQLLELERIRPGGKGIQVGHRPLDLLEDGDRIRLAEKRRAFDPDLDGAGVGGDVPGQVPVAAPHPQGDPGGFLNLEGGRSGN